MASEGVVMQRALLQCNATSVLKYFRKLYYYDFVSSRAQYTITILLVLGLSILLRFC
jgi:hypothetical protein